MNSMFGKNKFLVDVIRGAENLTEKHFCDGFLHKKWQSVWMRRLKVYFLGGVPLDVLEISVRKRVGLRKECGVGIADWYLLADDWYLKKDFHLISGNSTRSQL